ncbi:MAG: alpha/beta hydrolase [Alphaproteobacteria bacterium]|nr:alpha/beta hydrolase [Alphaproteobacteria bacterium]
MTPESAGQILRPDGVRLAYRATAGNRPGIVFLPGFRSDMAGTKALALAAHCRATGRAFTRFDYFGHGDSDGEFTDGTIGRWIEDAVAVLDHATSGPQILVGSSMGGWIMLHVALRRSQRVSGLVGVAAAPDFTEDLMWRAFPAEVRATLQRSGRYDEPSIYDAQPTPITLRLIDEARAHLVLRSRIPIHGLVRLLHGIADPDVPYVLSLRLSAALASDNVRVTLIKGGDHRLSRPEDLALLAATVDEVAAAAQ